MTGTTDTTELASTAYGVSPTPLPGGTMYRAAPAKDSYPALVLRILTASEGAWLGKMALLERVGVGTPGELTRALAALTEAGLIEAITTD